MAWNQSDLDALDAAYKQGARAVSYGDRRVEFQSVDDYLKLRNVMANDIAQAAARKPVRQVRVYTGSGWDA